MTTMGFMKVGDSVNIETDIIGKYVERFTRNFANQYTGTENKASPIDETLLTKAGFM
jgi:riboflavin synthase